MPALTIRLPQDAAAALRDLAQIECRTPRDQAAFLVIQGLRAPAPRRHQPRRGHPEPVRASGEAAEAEA
jgi:hypothetical protein